MWMMIASGAATIVPAVGSFASHHLISIGPVEDYFFRLKLRKLRQLADVTGQLSIADRLLEVDATTRRIGVRSTPQEVL